MKDYYIPVLVDGKKGKSLWRFDLTEYSITELSEIRKKLLEYAPYTGTITSLDKLIREKAENMMQYNRVHNKSYIKVYKENRKQEKLKKHKKIRRR